MREVMRRDKRPFDSAQDRQGTGDTLVHAIVQIVGYLVLSGVVVLALMAYAPG